ncbi:hypothetical protein PG987_016513 [Apiospora arundinis]
MRTRQPRCAHFVHGRSPLIRSNCQHHTVVVKMAPLSRVLGAFSGKRRNSSDHEETAGLILGKHQALDPVSNTSRIFQMTPASWCLAASLILNLAFFVVVVIQDNSMRVDCAAFDVNLESSPVKGAIGHEDVNFILGNPDDQSPYIGRNATEVDEMWNRLYGPTLFHANRGELLDIVPAFAAHPGPNDDKYIFGIYVFHQIHCINLLRKKINPAMYPPDPSNPLLSVDHLNHCIEQLRQSVMCSNDVTPLSWHWDKTPGDATLFATLPHRCRKFDRIQSWAFNDVSLRPFEFNNEDYGE